MAFKGQCEKQENRISATCMCMGRVYRIVSGTFNGRYVLCSRANGGRVAVMLPDEECSGGVTNVDDMAWRGISLVEVEAGETVTYTP